MVIESIHLKNFQSHEDREVVFGCPGITTIRGATDVGKSAVVRALNWVLLNNIAGGDFVRHGAKVAEVCVRIRHKGKPYEIVRRRSASGAVNTYEMNGKEFKAFGVGVPDEIKNVIELNEINFQNQHDSPFWFSESSGEVSRRLNAIIDLSVIDTALYNIGAKVRTAQERQKIAKEKIEETSFDLERVEAQAERIREFEKLDSANARLEECNAKIQALNQAVLNHKHRAQQVVDLNEMVKDLTGLEKTAESHQKHAKQAAKLSAIISSAKKDQVSASRNLSGFSDISDTFSKLKEKRAVSLSLSKLIDLVKSNKPREVPPFDKVESAWNALMRAQAKVNALSFQVSRIRERKLSVSALEAAATNAEDEFHQAIKGSLCPLCQSPL